MPDGFGYDTYDEAVVTARSPEEAQRIHPGLGIVQGEEEFSRCNAERWNFNTKIQSWPNDLNLIKVQYIGTAAPDLGFGVVVASFHAG